ncbi:DNA (cytosine-5-)-methyltransferase [Purpureocillium takamizusanense]|uniref:DNA (cytosine-5-)-methyltransferase n=1 Tax=Purpureocillium takamizusanense TaxID=2060973 RepID=A0A9Q8V939_9HYPO|nr:DNA (cytosine-5-)-methyltransferase [Purpureocillium takamizusanense]UNI17825.1 DNA (cytosine-5-)-methyltransferase [Purpureocillium takamizusanense]
MPRLSNAEMEDLWEELAAPEGSIPVHAAVDIGAEARELETPKWPDSESSVASPTSPAGSASLGSDAGASESEHAGGFTVDVPECNMISPLSCYEPFDAGAPTMSESRALATLAPEWKRLRRSDDDDVEGIEYDLDDFAAYCDATAYPCEMRPLHQLDTKMGVRNLYFDGVLSIGGQHRIFVRRVPIAAMPIGNYGTQHDTAQGHIWLQSELNRNRSIYYKLGKPAREYLRYYRPMLWVVDLAKHFVDYLQVTGDASKSVQIHHFRSVFIAWLQDTQKSSLAFDAWRRQHPSPDFRSSVVAHINFLHKEAVGVLGYKATYKHDVWSEALLLTAYEPQPRAKDPKTVVTQYMYDLFKDMPFGDQLIVAPISPNIQQLRDELIHERRMELPSPVHEAVKDVSSAAEARIRDVKPGDTISTPRDDEASGSMWKREVSKGFHDVDRWFALVQSVRTAKSGKRVFDVIWYYRPVETLCGVMHYPWNNELFLSDHCSCKERNKISEDEVLGVHEVDFGGSSATTAEFFCRQTYVHAERKWVTLREKHKHCKHTMERRRPAKYRPGDTLLVHLDTKSSLAEPCELVSSYREGDGKIYRLRRLLRRRDVDQEAHTSPPNELVYSSSLIEGRKNRIVGRCRVRFFPAGSHIPTPYDRNGVGGYFFFSYRLKEAHDGVRRCEALDAAPESLRQGWNPAATVPQLQGVDLFCGGGNFGRGLEDGGAIEMRWANDYDSKAVHTYMANVEVPGRVTPFLGSIDDMQRRAMAGDLSSSVPRVGDVDFVSAGSPCPGFSRLTNDKTTVAQRKNQSLVAAFGSFVDLYRPRYALLENVPGIVHKRANRDQDVFSQLICAVVGLGYQARFFFLDASSCGSPQRRSRVFLALAAPGCQLPDKPLMTHSHPPQTKALGLGMLPTGEPMAVREMPRATPFHFVTALEATADLPVIYDAKPDTCVPFPDHRVSLGLTRSQRLRIAVIPTHPWGMNFSRAWYGTGATKKPGHGIMTLAERAFFAGTDSGSGTASPINDNNRVGEAHASSNAYGRMYPDRLIETIVTTQNPRDGKNGRSLHWSEDRVLTIMEARRAQGMRDHEVLLGSPATQFKIVGNSVAREVAVALGIVFREAWVETLLGDKVDDEGIEGDGGIDGADAVPSPMSWGDAPHDRPEQTASLGSSPPPPARKRSQSLAAEMSDRKRRRGETPGSQASIVMAPSPLGRAVMMQDENAEIDDVL